jgi:hypothetical protein
MRKARYFPALILAVLLIGTGCKKTTTIPQVTAASYFMPLQVGKEITYRLDSLTFYYYGQLDTTTSYLAMDSVEMATTDNQGRPSWLITRYITDTAGINPWSPSETYMVTPTSSDVEMVENNLRFEKLAYPVTANFAWGGNDYLPYNPYQDFFSFSYDSHINLAAWTYDYEQVNNPFAVFSQTYNNTATVLLDSNYLNVPIVDPTIPASVAYWTETYARNIGLIYRHTAMWEYQPPTQNGTQLGYKIGFEVTLSIINHN